MLKDCIEIFQKKVEHMGNECGNADALILDNYIPADALILFHLLNIIKLVLEKEGECE